MNMSNFESAIDDYNALLDVRPNNTVVQGKIELARLGLANMTQRQKSMYSLMFNKVCDIRLFHSDHDQRSLYRPWDAGEMSSLSSGITRGSAGDDSPPHFSCKCKFMQ